MLPPARDSHNWQFFFVGVLLASVLQTSAGWLMQLPLLRRLYQRFVWFKPFQWAAGPFQGAFCSLPMRHLPACPHMSCIQITCQKQALSEL